MSNAIERKELPELITLTQRSIEDWRKSRRPRQRLPEDLWREATSLARAHGIHRIAKALKLDYYSLKKRIAAEDASRSVPPGFIEVLRGTVPVARPECVIEMEGDDNPKLRIIIKGAELPEVAAMARAIRDGRP